MAAADPAKLNTATSAPIKHVRKSNFLPVTDAVAPVRVSASMCRMSDPSLV
jgi:hypothetical protein